MLFTVTWLMEQELLPFRSTWGYSYVWLGSCSSIFIFLCSVLEIIVCLFVPFLLVIALSFFCRRLLITPLLSSNFYPTKIILIVALSFSINWKLVQMSITDTFKWPDDGIWSDVDTVLKFILWYIGHHNKKKLWIILNIPSGIENTSFQNLANIYFRHLFQRQTVCFPILCKATGED